MYTDILIRYGEIGLKGKNRKTFEKILVRNIKECLRDLGQFNVERTYGRIYLRQVDGLIDQIVERLARVPGIVSLSPVVKTGLDMEEIKEMALRVLEDALPDGGTFKVETKRANKNFPLISPEINRQVSAHLLINFSKELKVDVHNPDTVVFVEVRSEHVYLYSKVIDGPGGLPVGSSGRGLLLLSGGIDSPVAGWLGMKRGVIIDALHFYSFPFTSERSKEKVIELAKVLARYSGKMRLFIGYFTNIQKAIGLKCPERLHITIMRRMMFRMATEIAHRYNAKVLFTGESIGQVASQTLESMEVINAVTNIPVLRPLITMDKTEIMDLARKIGTYEISIQPYEDCCTVFVPDAPATRPRLKDAEAAEKDLMIDQLIKEAIERSTVLIITPDGVEAEYSLAEEQGVML
ncbi:tRNA 4-thiouridine(8) synthase ThiI [Anoxybacter fermentans]|uniref:Probable tRNA sulfurtransferase n=1 Tax=Anoxybacter fermentans TaxID=1323375 RepID=A0A3S9T1T4_9FIRM|nr:tRNA uracil 4-sulfurtransferase ThiI [Anoxybacter fermentans]AZR74489.1 tRNA 4-thiouridine(8) synthase ThiI [Anoxybacter fermentans]